MDGQTGRVAAASGGGNRSWLRLALPQVLFFLGILVLQFLAALAGGLGCGDDGPVDYGTANDLQERYCDEIGGSTLEFMFWSPLVVFVAGNGLTRLRATWKPLLAALPVLLVTALFPLALWAPGLAIILLVAAVSVGVWRWSRS